MQNLHVLTFIKLENKYKKNYTNFVNDTLENSPDPCPESLSPLHKILFKKISSNTLLAFPRISANVTQSWIKNHFDALILPYSHWVWPLFAYILLNVANKKLLSSDFKHCFWRFVSTIFSMSTPLHCIHSFDYSQ